MINSFAWRLGQEYPDLDVDDIRSEAWLRAVEARESWKKKGGASFSTFLYQSLIWLRQQLLDKRAKRLEAERGFTVHIDPFDTVTDPGLDTLCGEILNRLTEDEIEVLRLMVNPSPAFLRFVEQSWQDRNYSRTRKTTTVQFVHYASWLGTYPTKITRIVHRITEVVLEVANDN